MTNSPVSNKDHSSQTLLSRYVRLFKNSRYLSSFAFAILFLVASLFTNMLAGEYAAGRASQPVSDIILSNIPVVDVDSLFVYGPIIFWLIAIAYSLKRPEGLPFWLKSIALFTLVRSVFITLTHIGPFPDRSVVDSFSLFPNVNLFIFSSGADLFFSGHTGLPYLLGLIYWDDRRMRVFCFAASIFFGIVVLLGHLHYSIDVISAFFITYSIYRLARHIFARDSQRLEVFRRA